MHVVAEIAYAAGRIDGLRLARTEAAQVERDHPQVGGQREHDLLPKERRRDVAVYQHDRAFGSGLDAVGGAFEQARAYTGGLDDSLSNTGEKCAVWHVNVLTARWKLRCLQRGRF